MIKSILLAFLIFFSNYTKAQQTIDIPNQKEYEKYLLSRIDSIQLKLYRLAMVFKIKTYKNDSLTSVFNYQELLERGRCDKLIWVPTDSSDPEIGYDSLVFNPFNPKDLKGLGFVSKSLSSPFETDEKTKLIAIGILFQPKFGGVTFNTMPFALFDPNEVQAALSPNEFEFLKLYYYFCKQGGGYFKHYDTYDDIYCNNFFELSSLKTKLILGDSLQNKLIYSMLNSNDFYSEIWNNETQKILFDEQKKTLISSDEFINKYRFLFTVELDLDEPVIILDSIVFHSGIFDLPYQLEFNSNNSLDKVRFKLTNMESKSNKTYTFSITKKDLIESGFQPTMIWFYEDYYRWLNK